MSGSSGVNDYVTGLGVLAHGPAVLSRGPSVGIGLQCVFAYPSGLLLCLEIKAIDDTAGLIHQIQWRPSRPSRRGPRQRSPGVPRSHWQLTASTDGLERLLVVHSTSRTLSAHGGSDAEVGDPLYTEDHDTWLPHVPPTPASRCAPAGPRSAPR